MISDYLTEFHNIPDIEEKSLNLTKRWNKLLKNLLENNEDFSHVVQMLKALEDEMAKYEKWLRDMDARIKDLPLLQCNLRDLKLLKRNIQVSQVRVIMHIAY